MRGIQTLVVNHILGQGCNCQGNFGARANNIVGSKLEILDHLTKCIHGKFLWRLYHNKDTSIQCNPTSFACSRLKAKALRRVSFIG